MPIHHINYLIMRNQIILISLLFLLLGSCTSKKDIYYFQDIDKLLSETNIAKSSENIQVNDELLILVTSLDLEATKPFNLLRLTGDSRSETMTYLVDSKGNIDMPTLGQIHVEGKTRIEVRDLLEAELKRYIKDVIVNVRILNFRVTILGDVKTPGTYPVESEKINIFQALGLAGDLNVSAMRKNIVLIRDNGTHKEYQKIDLTSSDLINATYYHLQQNDIIYIPPNAAKIKSASINPIYSFALSTLSSVIGLITLAATIAK